MHNLAANQPIWRRHRYRVADCRPGSARPTAGGWRTAGPRPGGCDRDRSCRHPAGLDVDRRIGSAILAQLHPALLGQFQGGDEGRGDGRLHLQRVAQDGRQIGRQHRPVGHAAQHALQPAQSVLDRIKIGRLDMQRAHRGPHHMVGIGLQQVEQLHVVQRAGDHLDSFRFAAGEEMPAQLRPAHQGGAGTLHRFQPAQAEGQDFRHLGGGRLLARLGLGFGQQQARLQIGQPRRHHQIFGGQVQMMLADAGDEFQILVGQLQDRQLGKIDLLLARQGQQNVQRPLESVEIQQQPFARLLGRPVFVGLENVALHDHAISCVTNMMTHHNMTLREKARGPA
ncbi:hypothetical protein MTBLM5_120102 [Magnetospirillum sp. LM-5]|nr:hypothetical protein MTBLM5_120102 [Magnetospirillum sp. LM-5]